VPELHDLDRFEDGLPTMNPLPAPEIRRRGDRLRRRRIGLVAGGVALLAVLAVGSPLLGGSDDRARDLQPAPAPTGDAGWITTVPDDFPLADGFPQPSEVRTQEDPELEPVCGHWQVTAEEIKVVHYTGESEDSAQRVLMLFKDSDAARAQFAALRSSTTSCDPIPGAPGSHEETSYGPVPLDHVARGAEETYAFSEQIRHDDGLVSDLTLVEVSRTGNALYFDSRYTAAGGDVVIAEELPAMEKASRVPLGALCRFAQTPCPQPGTPSATPSGS